MFLWKTAHKFLRKGVTGSNSLLGSAHDEIPFCFRELRWYQSCCAVGISFLPGSQKEKTCIITHSTGWNPSLFPFACLPGPLIWIFCLGWTGFLDTVTGADFTNSAESPGDFGERGDGQAHCQAATQPRVRRCHSVILTKYKIQSQ